MEGAEGNIWNRSTQDAQNIGIATVYQEINLCPNLSVAENLFVGRQPRTRIHTVDWKTMDQRAQKIMKTAAVGGPYGMALLASYAADRCAGETLEDFLQNRVFRDVVVHTTQPAAEDVAAFSAYLRRFKAGLVVEKAAAVLK